VPSQDSPESIATLPQRGFSVQPVVSSWHVAEHFKVPPANDEIKEVHVLIWPNIVPSQDSPESRKLFPHVETFMHPEGSKSQSLVHLKVPLIKFVKSVQPFIEPNIELP
jgi:hypothetical protein